MFIVDGDITRLHCDAWLMPTDGERNLVDDFAEEAERLGGDLGPWTDERRLFRPLCPPAIDAPQVWLGSIAHADPGPEWFGDCAQSFITDAAPDARARDLTGRAKPLVALPAIGTRHGGGWREKGAILESVIARASAAAVREDVDVALVTWGASRAESQAMHSAAQRARHRLATAGQLPGCDSIDPSMAATIKELARRAQGGDLVLFLGAGVSAGAGLPTWGALLDTLAETAGFDTAERERLSKLDPRDQASIISRGSPDLRKHVAKAIEAARYPLAAGLLASLPTTEGVTTNYDNLFETAVRSRGEDLAVLPYQSVTHAGQRWLLKLHGTVDGEADDIVLTRADYLGAPQQHAALFGLVQAMLLTRHMLFVGYSLTDDDFHQLVHEVRLALPAGHHQPVGTALVLFEDRLQELLWEDTIEVVAMTSLQGGATGAEAARRLEIFLDHLAHEATDNSAFLLSDGFDDLMEDDDQEVRRALRTLAATASNGPMADKVHHLLTAFGHPPQTAATQLPALAGSAEEGYDIVGDVHGCHQHLVALLHELGYTNDHGPYRHPTRTMVFVGDLIDRGPGQTEVLRLVRHMVGSGSAQVVMGNHEFNAMAFATPHPDRPGDHLRSRTEKNLGQHIEFLAQVGPGSADHRMIIDWFATLPLWLDLGGLRVVHACWDPAAMAGLGTPTVDRDRLLAASTEGEDAYRWVESLCKGPEVDLPEGISFHDPSGIERTVARYRWWDARDDTYASACEVPDDVELPESPMAEPPVVPYLDSIPVLFGHYWRRWPQIDMVPNAACLDYSAVKGGPLVAYRWSGETELRTDHLLAAYPGGKPSER